MQESHEPRRNRVLLAVPEVTKLFRDKNDRQNLHESGITDETIRANGLWTATTTDKEKIANMLNCGIRSDACLGGLVYPYRDLNGNTNGFGRLRPLRVPLNDRSTKSPVRRTDGRSPLRIQLPAVRSGKNWCRYAGQ